MKKLILCFLLFGCALHLKAQDVIYLHKGNMFECKIGEVGEQEVQYSFKSAPHVKYTLKREEIKNMFFAQTLVEVQKRLAPKDSIIQVPRSRNVSATMFIQGGLDAERYYHNHTGAGTGTLVATLLTGGIVGVIVALGTSETKPKYHNLGFPNAQLMEDIDYKRGYIDAAYRKKRRRVWNNFGAGIGVLLVTSLILSVK